MALKPPWAGLYGRGGGRDLPRMFGNLPNSKAGAFVGEDALFEEAAAPATDILRPTRVSDGQAGLLAAGLLGLVGAASLWGDAALAQPVFTPSTFVSTQPQEPSPSTSWFAKASPALLSAGKLPEKAFTGIPPHSWPENQPWFAKVVSPAPDLGWAVHKILGSPGQPPETRQPSFSKPFFADQSWIIRKPIFAAGQVSLDQPTPVFQGQTAGIPPSGEKLPPREITEIPNQTPDTPAPVFWKLAPERIPLMPAPALFPNWPQTPDTPQPFFQKLAPELVPLMPGGTAAIIPYQWQDPVQASFFKLAPELVPLMPAGVAFAIPLQQESPLQPTFSRQIPVSAVIEPKLPAREQTPISPQYPEIQQPGFWKLAPENIPLMPSGMASVIPFQWHDPIQATFSRQPLRSEDPKLPPKEVTGIPNQTPEIRQPTFLRQQPESAPPPPVVIGDAFPDPVRKRYETKRGPIKKSAREELRELLDNPPEPEVIAIPIPIQLSLEIELPLLPLDDDEVPPLLLLGML